MEGAVFQRVRRHAVQALGHPERNEDAGANETVEAGKGRRGHADDGEDDSVEVQAAADGGSAARIVLLPEVVAEQRDGNSGFVGQRRAAGFRSHARHGKKVVAHQAGKANLCRRRGVGGHRQGGEAICGQAAEGAASGAQIAVIGERHAFQGIVGRGAADIEHGGRIFDRERAQERRVGEAEDGAVGPDGERQREHREAGKCGLPAQRTEGIADVRENAVEPRPAPGGAHVLPRQGEVAEFLAAGNRGEGCQFLAHLALFVAAAGRPQIFETIPDHPCTSGAGCQHPT